MFFTKVNNWIENNKAISYLLLFLLVFVFFTWLEYAPVFSDPDSFYHAKVTQIMSEEGVIRDFPYLQFTTLREGYIDHHLAYHLYLIPFVKIFPLAVGVKIGHILLVCLAFLMFYWLLNKMKVYFAHYYTLLLFFAAPFVFRMGLIKAQPLSLIFLFLGSYLILNRKYILLFVLSWFYVWSYGGWFLMLILAGIYVFVESLDVAIGGTRETLLSKIMNFGKGRFGFIDRIYSFIIYFIRNAFKIENIFLIGSVFCGLTAGLVINPYFPKNLEFYWVHIIKIAFINYQDTIGVGAEWYPYTPNQFFTNSMIPVVLGFAALLIFLNYHKKFDIKVKYFLALFLAFLLATLKSRRNIEYFTPFGIIFAGVVFSRAIDIRSIKNDLKEFKKALRKILLYDLYIKIFLGMCLAFFIGLVVFNMPYQAKKELSDGANYNYLAGASQYLINNSEQGEIVLHSDWDEFPMLFFHNNHNYYIVGLDATFMYLYDSELYEKWVDITQGKRYKKLYNIIKDDFEASYILSTTDHEDMIRSLDNNFYFDKVYEDNEAIIYKVL